MKHELLRAIEKSGDQSQPVNIEGLQEQIKHTEEKIKIFDAELAQARVMLVKNIFTEDEYMVLKIKSEQGRSELERSQRAIKFQIQSFFEAQKKYETLDVSKITEKYRERIEELDFEEKQVLTKTLVKAVSIGNDGGMHLKLRDFNKALEI